MDGKLYVLMRDLNAAARAAIRNGDLQAALSDYTFHHLRNATTAAVQPAPAPATAKPQTQPAAS